MRILDLGREHPPNYRDAAEAHYRWKTQAPHVADQERQLIESAFLPLSGRLLDVGCGEGATLYHLGEPQGAVGVDLFEEKLAFARRELPRCRFVAASATALPFEAGSFDHVIVRDLVHHLPDPALLVSEVHRVLAPGGRFDVLEPCRANPLVLAQGVLLSVERGALRSTPRYLRQLLLPHFRIERTRRHQALPLHRVVFHPRLGTTRVASALAVSVVHASERLAAAVLPRAAWAYVSFRARPL